MHCQGYGFSHRQLWPGPARTPASSTAWSYTWSAPRSTKPLPSAEFLAFTQSTSSTGWLSIWSECFLKNFPQIITLISTLTHLSHWSPDILKENECFLVLMYVVSCKGGLFQGSARSLKPWPDILNTISNEFRVTFCSLGKPFPSDWKLSR